MSTVDDRDSVVDYMMKINWIEENIYAKFDKLGCMYVNQPNVHRPDFKGTDRIYRRNDIAYGISTDTVVVYLYDKDFNIRQFEDYAADYGFHCPTCEYHNNSEYYLIWEETTIDALNKQLDVWIEEHYASSEPSS